MVPLSFGCGSAVFAAIATLAPSRAARSAIASPMPRLPPDTNRLLFFSDVIAPSLAASAADCFSTIAQPPRRHGCADRGRRAIPSPSRRLNWLRSAPLVQRRDGLWPSARPACRRQNRARSALHPAAIDGAAAAPPPPPRRPCHSLSH